MIILPCLEYAPRVINIVTYPQIICQQLVRLKFKFISRHTIHFINREIFAPILVPVLAVVSFDHIDQYFNTLRDSLKPVIVFIGIFISRGKQFNDRAQRTTTAQYMSRFFHRIISRYFKPRGIIFCHNFFHHIQIGIQVVHHHRSLDHGILNRLGDLRLSATRNGTRLMAQGSLGHRAHQMPFGTFEALFHLHFIAIRIDVVFVWQQLDHLLLPCITPGNGLFGQVKKSIFRHINHISVFFIDSIPFRFQFQHIGKQIQERSEVQSVVGQALVEIALFTQIITTESDRTTGMFFFGQPI